MSANRIGIALLFFLMLCACADQDPGGALSPEDLAQKVRDGLEEKDAGLIVRLGCWDRAPDDLREKLGEQIGRWIDLYDEPSCTIREMSAKEREPIKAQGKEFVWNIEPVGFVVIKGNDPDLGSSDLPFGKRNGRYYLAVRYPAKNL